MKYPKFIQKNGCISVPAPSAGAGVISKQNQINSAKETFERLGYKVLLSENIFKNEKGRSATAVKRAEEINSMYQDETIDMLICAAGGDFLIEILPYVDFNLVENNLKWIAGFSDPTGLLYTITSKYDIATIYGQNFGSFGMVPLHQSQQDFLEIIQGNLIEEKSYSFYEKTYSEKVTGLEEYNLTEPVYWKTLDNKSVNVEGRIIGGCFDIISELAGTKYDGIERFNEKYQNDGIIWYFDNCELSKEETIRVLWKMNELEYFKYTKCVIFGRFGVDSTYYDYDTKSCLEDSILGDLNIPVIYDADISHRAPTLTIINGSIANVSVSDGKGKISFLLK